jgi:hypothetical protein
MIFSLPYLHWQHIPVITSIVDGYEILRHDAEWMTPLRDNTENLEKSFHIYKTKYFFSVACCLSQLLAALHN